MLSNISRYLTINFMAVSCLNAQLTTIYKLATCSVGAKMLVGEALPRN